MPHVKHLSATINIFSSTYTIHKEPINSVKVDHHKLLTVKSADEIGPAIKIRAALTPVLFFRKTIPIMKNRFTIDVRFRGEKDKKYTI